LLANVAIKLKEVGALKPKVFESASLASIGQTEYSSSESQTKRAHYRNVWAVDPRQNIE